VYTKKKEMELKSQKVTYRHSEIQKENHFHYYLTFNFLQHVLSPYYHFHVLDWCDASQCFHLNQNSAVF